MARARRLLIVGLALALCVFALTSSAPVGWRVLFLVGGVLELGVFTAFYAGRLGERTARLLTGVALMLLLAGLIGGLVTG